MQPGIQKGIKHINDKELADIFIIFLRHRKFQRFKKTKTFAVLLDWIVANGGWRKLIRRSGRGVARKEKIEQARRKILEKLKQMGFQED